MSGCQAERALWTMQPYVRYRDLQQRTLSDAMHT
jgi:hypothetical protein